MATEPIVVCLDQDFTVELESAPTTGYTWSVSLRAEGLRFLGSDFAEPGQATQPGDSRVQVFRFKALGRGDHVISFQLKREWETHAVESRAVTVRVH